MSRNRKSGRSGGRNASFSDNAESSFNDPDGRQDRRSAARRKSGGKGSGAPRGQDRLYGTHAVMEALQNDARQLHRLYLSKEAVARHGPDIDAILRERGENPPIHQAGREDLDRLVGSDAVHQGMALDCSLLEDPGFETIPGYDDDTVPSLLVMLDQVTDPHNIGAILRSAAVFGAEAVIVQDKGTPQITATAAKSACGGVEHVPLIRVTNLARTLDELHDKGYQTWGLAAEGEDELGAVDLKHRTVLIMGAEGSGLRRLTRERCTGLTRLPAPGPLPHLNVSNAAAIALYEVVRQRQG